MNELMIQCDNGDTYDLDEWTDHCKQLGRCGIGHHGEKKRVRNLYFHAYGKEVDAYRCETCGQLFDKDGVEINRTPAWQTINPSQLSMTEGT